MRRWNGLFASRRAEPRSASQERNYVDFVDGRYVGHDKVGAWNGPAQDRVRNLNVTIIGAGQRLVFDQLP
jgi:hypothetical protein